MLYSIRHSYDVTYLLTYLQISSNVEWCWYKISYCSDHVLLIYHASSMRQRLLKSSIVYDPNLILSTLSVADL